MNPDSLRVEQLPAADVQPLRTEILRPHFDPGQLCEFPGDYRTDTRHFGLVDEQGQSWAVVTFLVQPCPDKPDWRGIRLRGMAVAKSAQRHGLGSRLLDAAVGRLALSHARADIVWCNARISAAPFYASKGFCREGEVFEVDAVGPHIVMWKRLPPAIA